MDPQDPLLRLLVDFFELPADTRPEDVTQQLIAPWDSLATVQLITDLEQAFSVSFDIEEIGKLRSYHEIRDALAQRGIRIDSSAVESD